MSKRVRFSCWIQPEYLEMVKARKRDLSDPTHKVSEGAVVEHAIHNMEQRKAGHLGLIPGQVFGQEDEQQEEST